MSQASPEYRLDEQALNNMFVRNGTEMAPISQFVTLKRVLGPEVANRFNLFSCITVNVNPAPGYSTGEVQQAIEEVAAQMLPTGYGYEYGGMAREEANTGGSQTLFIYAVCILLIYLILACLYESFIVPWAVILSVPFGLMGSFLFAKLFGLENNIYLQTGVIMLIGLLAKTAILITEFAIERRRKGMGIVESAYSAAQARLRPILMTVLTMIFGMLPLMFAPEPEPTVQFIRNRCCRRYGSRDIGIAVRRAGILHHFRIHARKNPSADGSGNRYASCVGEAKEPNRT